MTLYKSAKLDERLSLFFLPHLPPRQRGCFGQNVPEQSLDPEGIWQKKKNLSLQNYHQLQGKGITSRSGTIIISMQQTSALPIKPSDSLAYKYYKRLLRFWAFFLLKGVIRKATVHVHFESTTHASCLRTQTEFQTPFPDNHEGLTMLPRGVLVTDLDEVTVDGLRVCYTCSFIAFNSPCSCPIPHNPFLILQCLVDLIVVVCPVS